MFPLLPLVGLAIDLVPRLTHLFFGDKAGDIAQSVGRVVAEVTGTTDPAEAQKRINEDPNLKADLQERLAEIELRAQHERLVFQDKEGKRQAELAAVKTDEEGTANARAMMVAAAP